MERHGNSQPTCETYAKEIEEALDGKQAGKKFRKAHLLNELEKAVDSLTSQSGSAKRRKTPSKITGRQYNYVGHKKVNSLSTRPRHRDCQSSTTRANVYPFPDDIPVTDEAADMTYSSVEANKEYDNSEETDCDLKFELDSLCREIEHNLEECQSQSSPTCSWRQRIERREEAWEVNRGAIFEHAVRKESLSRYNNCSLCGKKAFIRCSDCSTYLLCTACDDAVHSNHPLHNRDIWCGSHFVSVPPTTTICEETLEFKTTRRFWPLKYPWRCPRCETEGLYKRVPVNQDRCIVITPEGRFDLDACTLKCEHCLYTLEDMMPSIIDSGFWPGNLTRSHQYLFSKKVFDMFDLLHKVLPGTSICGFLHSLEEVSALNGRVSTINQETFMKGFEEFRYCRMEMQQKQHILPFECPACHRKQHSAHVDGNKKLYRYSKVPRGIRDSYYKGMFFANNEEVDHHLELVNYHDESQEGICGTSRWKAAKATSKTMKGLDETGIVVAGCRHMIAQKAINMFRGEIYGYTHFLHAKFLRHQNLDYLMHDVICKYWPWANKTTFPDTINGNDITPCLPVMHAKAHTWHCQVLWGARWQDGAGAGSGEDMELFFSYISRWSSSTKYMLAYRREDFLTEAVRFWNQRKIDSLPHSLIQRLKKTNERLLALEGKLNELQLTSAFNVSACNLQIYKENIQAVARGELNKGFSDVDSLEQYFKLWRQTGIATTLAEFSTSGDTVDSIILESSQLYKEATSVVSRSQTNAVRLEELEEQLLITDDASREHCLREGRQLAINTCLERFQADMEMLFLSIKRKQVSVKNSATSSKQRAHLRHSVATEKKRLETCIDKYN